MLPFIWIKYKNSAPGLGLGFEKLLPHMLSRLPPAWRAQHQIWQVSLQQIQLCTAASRLDLTVPSSPIKSEAQREECVNPAWRAALPTQRVDVASRQPCENISADWCSLEPTAKVLSLTMRQRTVATASSACQQPLPRALWLLPDYHVFLISALHAAVCCCCQTLLYNHHDFYWRGRTSCIYVCRRKAETSFRRWANTGAVLERHPTPLLCFPFNLFHPFVHLDCSSDCFHAIKNETSGAE